MPLYNPPIQPHGLRPTDLGVLEWVADPVLFTAGTLVATAGVLNIVKLYLPQRSLITNLHVTVTVGGATLTANQCLAALYQDAALLGTTTNQATAWVSAGSKTMALVTPVTVPAGVIEVGFWYNGTTAPTLARAAASAALVNAGLAAASSRSGLANAALTTTAPATRATLTAGSIGWWAAVS